jgi:hypothetical protein
MTHLESARTPGGSCNTELSPVTSGGSRGPYPLGFRVHACSDGTDVRHRSHALNGRQSVAGLPAYSVAHAARLGGLAAFSRTYGLSH